MRAPVTWLETGKLYSDGTPIRRRHAAGKSAAKNPVSISYTCPNDVPVPMRHTIRTCHGNGFSIKDLSLVYELPEQWVQLFVMPD